MTRVVEVKDLVAGYLPGVNILNSTNQGVGIMGPGASFGAKGMKKNVQNPNFN